MPVLMQAYAEDSSVSPGDAIAIAVTPGSPRFRFAFFRQLGGTALTAVTPPSVVGQRCVTVLDSHTFGAAPLASASTPDLDWGWPRVSFRVPVAWDSGVYFAAVYPVDASGSPTDDLGRAIVAGTAIAPIPPLSDGLALFVVKPTAAAVAARTRKIAYVLAVSTFHAYNDAGGGSYYTSDYATVTWRRPGGGTGAPDRPIEADPYDMTSRRNVYAHWDAKFIGWLVQQNLACDFYSSADLDAGCLVTGTQKNYELMLSVGHDEYWSTPMRDAMRAFMNAGGNVAIFSGNTCYRPIAFDTTSRMRTTRLATQWPDSDNEASTIGVTFSEAGGAWNPDGVTLAQRPATGYEVGAPGHWVFRDTGVTTGTFGAGTDPVTSPPGHLVGYECDGVRAGVTPSPNTVLASAALANVGTYTWSALYGAKTATMMIYGPESTPVTGNLFNAATTDWARLLTNPSEPDQQKLEKITLNVVRTLAHLG
jgi:hypothetical protein